MEVGAFAMVTVWLPQHLNEVLNLLLDFIDSLHIAQPSRNILGLFYIKFICLHEVLVVKVLEYESKDEECAPEI